MLKVQEKRKEAKIEAEEKLGREKTTMMEDKRALSVVEGKLLKEGALEDQLILGREIQFSLPFLSPLPLPNAIYIIDNHL
mmetsp:Transcript_6972/g.15046  ORF Transcript_6972/g.15046 Transcript_6972/m.15046 type:complete len:80 (-) Transcript_6972:300-539(-)